jgi:succinate dehydrogenase hydrophobic anchor subunit
MTIISLIAVFLHMLSHIIPVLVTNETCYKIIEPYLHNPIMLIIAWCFLPLFIYHLWNDRRIHKEMHRLQEENKDLRNKLLLGGK